MDPQRLLTLDILIETWRSFNASVDGLEWKFKNFDLADNDCDNKLFAFFKYYFARKGTHTKNNLHLK